jgi:hypothetical protein
MTDETTTTTEAPQGISSTSFEDVVIERHAENARREIQRERALTESEKTYRDAIAARDVLGLSFSALAKDASRNKAALDELTKQIKELDRQAAIAESYVNMEIEQRRQAEWEAAETERLEEVAKKNKAAQILAKGGHSQPRGRRSR